MDHVYWLLLDIGENLFFCVAVVSADTDVVFWCVDPSEGDVEDLGDGVEFTRLGDFQCHIFVGIFLLGWFRSDRAFRDREMCIVLSPPCACRSRHMCSLSGRGYIVSTTLEF